MKRILMIFAMLAVMVAGLNLAQSAFAQGKASPECKTECNTCATVCEKTVAYCEKQGGKHAEAAHINAIKDCVATCKMSDKLMSHDSDLMSKSCALCKEACLKCAETCDTFKGDKQMKECADECRKCAKSCEKMAG